MRNLKTRLVTIPLAGAALAIGAGFLAASTASAAEGPHPDPAPAPVGNLGKAINYGTHQVQMHLDAPMLGLNPALANPYGYTVTHVVPVGINIVSFTLQGKTIVDDGTGHPHD